MPGVGPTRAEALRAVDLGTVGALANVAEEDVVGVAERHNLPPKSMRKWCAAARELRATEKLLKS